MPQSQLPQEILNLIIDFVAQDARTQKDQMDALLACTFVASRLNASCKRYLFSNIVFPVDDKVRKRAKGFLKVLDGSSADLVRCIRSFTLLIDARSISSESYTNTRSDRLYKRVGSMLVGLYAKLGLRENHLHNVLQRLGHAYLHTLRIHAHHGVLEWGRITNSFQEALYALRCQETLQTFEVINITQIDRTFLAHGAPANNLRALRFWNASILPSLVNGVNMSLSVVEIKNLGHVDRFEFHPHSNFQYPFGPLKQPLPNLRTLVLSLPRQRNAMDHLCETLENFFPSVESLKIQDYVLDPASENPEAVFGRLSLTLSRLPKWRHLEIDVPLRPWDCFFLSILTLIFITRHGDRPFNIESLTIGVSMPSEPVDGAPHIRERYAHYLKTGLSIFDLSSNTPVIMNTQRARGPRLPQELFDHIIDLIACTAGDSDVKKKLTALRACSLVSKPFNLTCRKHCFSEIILYADGSVQKRSKRLLNVLLNAGNGGLVQYIRIFRIIISSQPLPQDISKLAPVTRRQRAASHLKRFGRKVGLWTNYLVDVLNVITGAPLHQLTIGTWYGMRPLDWRNFSDEFIAPLLVMRLRPGLKILRLYNILNLDESFVLEGAPTATLDALYLSNVDFKRSASLPLAQFNMGSLRPIQHLEFSPTPRFWKSALTRAMMVRPAHTFSNLWSLVIPFPDEPAVLKLFCKLVQSLSSTLLDLEIRNFPGDLETAPNIQPFSEARLQSGFGWGGGRSRCFVYWQEFQKCYIQSENPNECRPQSADYLECLHHTKEIKRAEAIRDEVERQQLHRAHQTRKAAETTAGGAITGVGLIAREKPEEGGGGSK
ncbi:hypothetical protein CVT26_006024 [Gymnopilus dilepis]|uniref:NADH dehydrogenase [ubiquinone] iron-sulfur protein 5 n=1 Tax=Gymnopilus dilepis TaxID=231916 RepID=A0A409Y1G8_9AGAR|nr:hypothetical protein CVT26_006024 [Gymnopilus dilepis]